MKVVTQHPSSEAHHSSIPVVHGPQAAIFSPTREKQQKTQDMGFGRLSNQYLVSLLAEGALRVARSEASAILGGGEPFFRPGRDRADHLLQIIAALVQRVFYADRWPW